MAENKENAQQSQEQDLNEMLKVRREKMEAFKELGVAPFGHRYEVTDYAEDIKKNNDGLEGDEEGPEVNIAGRLMAIRGHGKASFCTLNDRTGNIQVYFKIDVLGEEKYKQQFRKLDIGDIVGIRGVVFKTHRGEVTVRVEDFELLSKSLRPLPEKFHGLQDVDIRYRQRYLDLIMNQDVRETFRRRTKTINSIREYLDERGYLEVETPVLSTIAGGAAARPFITHHNTLDIDLYLRIATELNLKRLIVGGLDRVYEIGRIFRNEGMDVRHNPEFTSIEFYQAFADYTDMMDLTEGIVVNAAMKVLGTPVINYQGVEIDLSKVKRISMNDAVKEATGKDFMSCETVEEARKMADEIGVPYEERHGIGGILNAAFEEKVEETLMQPTFITGHPTEISPLAKRNAEDPRITDRFEFFIYGRELANGFTELNDPIDQKGRFEDQLKQREAGDDEAHGMDEDFVMALEYGLPPTGGVGIGIDRLVMFLTDAASIRDVLLFPTMKPLNAPAHIDRPENSAAAAPEKIDFSKVEVEPLYEDMVDFDTFCKCDFRAVKVKACEAVKKSKKLLQFTLDDGTGTDRTILSGIHAFYEPEELIGKTLVAIVNLPPRAMMGIESCGMLISAVHTEEGEEKLHLLQLDPHIPAGAKMC
ncbi:lysine--tRNA ligase [Selenomonas ruminis]|uniref:Lysine--tRNA ligase n=1 Tax=Selenomonas ruminis TaxID=2593411 RepID=A0A5D6W4F4_9FIRM|nr:lysine--tRNA ligase [Selenomonas sp. mPRGC5]TYZ21705.1 lysine--tRNA ligase [Selenomonas sp. mPRGC5]